MTPRQVADVLAKLAAFDQRTVGTADVLAWADVIGTLDFADCLAAVTQWYRENDARAMPANIRTLAMAKRDARDAIARQHERRLAIEAGPTTSDRSEQVTALVQSVAASLPKPDIQQRAVARARRERGFKLPEKKPRRKNPPPKDYPDPATTDAAALARNYLREGYTPAEVSERLAISRRWCERTARAIPEAS